MTKRKAWERPPQELTEDKCCPHCIKEGRDGREKACQEHGWAYRKWFEGWRTAVAR